MGSKLIILLTLFILCYLIDSVTYGFQLSQHVESKDPQHSATNSILDTRIKREIETFDNEDYPTATSTEEQNEPGFWDRIVKVALKLFSRFIEWLNSS